MHHTENSINLYINYLKLKVSIKDLKNINNNLEILFNDSTKSRIFMCNNHIIIPLFIFWKK